MKLINSILPILIFISVLVFSGCSATPKPSGAIAQSVQKTSLSENSRPGYTQALNKLKNKNYSDASNDLQKIMTENPGFIEGWSNLALAQLKAGNISQAKQALDNAIKLEQNSALIENLAGLIDVENGSYKSAEQHYATAIRLNPNLANSQYNLALLYDVYYQNVPKAIQHYERYLALTNSVDAETTSWVEELKRKLQ